MSRRGRLAVAAVGGAALAAWLFPVLWQLPAAIAFQRFVSTYYLETAVVVRRSYNVVSAVIYDYRGFDTMIEQLILFAAVLGVVLLTREQRGEREGEPQDARDDRRVPPTSAAVQLAGAVTVGLALLVALYVNLHPHITPGGGFQTGVLAASGLLALYLGERYATYDRLTPSSTLERVESLAAAAYVGVALVGLVAAGSLLTNVLPLGELGALYASGTIWVLNMIVAVEVAAGTLLVYTEFLDQAFRVRERGGG